MDMKHVLSALAVEEDSDSEALAPEPRLTELEAAYTEPDFGSDEE